MDASLHHSILQGSGIEPSPESSSTDNNHYNMLSANAFAQSNSHAHPRVLNPGFGLQEEAYLANATATNSSNETGIPVNQYVDSYAGANYTYPTTSNQNSTYLPQFLGSNHNLTPSFNIFARSISTIGQELELLPNPALHQTPYYSYGAVQPVSNGQIQPVPALQMPSTTQQDYSGPQQPPNHPLIPSSAVNVGASPHLASQLRQSRHSLQFPQSGASSAPSHQRRHSRTQSLASVGLPTTGSQQPRLGPQHTRARPRPAQGTHTSPPRQSSSHAQRNQSSTASTASTQPTSRAGDHYQITPQQQAQLLRSVRLRDLLRSMHTDGTQALHMYEESLRQGGDTYQSSPSPKEKQLDTPSESRPEPKETEELTVNLECKICMGQVVDTVMLPCGHAILCRWCADLHIPSRHGNPKGPATCPMCRAPVKKKHRIYLS